MMQKPKLCSMKYIYYPPLFSMFVKMAGTISWANKQKNYNIMPVIRRVGIKFDIISAGKLYPGRSGIKKYSWFEAVGYNEPSV
jgi:hypothetical protein